MNSAQFSVYKSHYLVAIRQVLAKAEPGRLDEIAFPAYSHANSLISRLFWKRLHIVINYIERSSPHERVLDFGCGSGVMLPFLAENCRQVVAADIDLLPLENVKRYIPLGANVEVFDVTKTAIANLPANSFDLILALDVLEHVKDLHRILTDLLRLLKPGGQMVVSGPTENTLYKFGRTLAGVQYSGGYHERGVEDIRLALARRVNIKHIATLYQFAPLFEIFTAIAP